MAPVNYHSFLIDLSGKFGLQSVTPKRSIAKVTKNTIKSQGQRRNHHRTEGRNNSDLISRKRQYFQLQENRFLPWLCQMFAMSDFQHKSPLEVAGFYYIILSVTIQCFLLKSLCCALKKRLCFIVLLYIVLYFPFLIRYGQC